MRQSMNRTSSPAMYTWCSLTCSPDPLKCDRSIPMAYEFEFLNRWDLIRPTTLRTSWIFMLDHGLRDLQRQLAAVDLVHRGLISQKHPVPQHRGHYSHDVLRR